MSLILLDTHAWAWLLTEPHRLPGPARAAVEAAEAVCLSTLSFYEIAQKVRLGKWPEMAPHVPALEGLLVDRGGTPVAPGSAVCLLAGGLDWPHRDPFDRLIAATAIALDAALVSADPAFDPLPLRRIWA